MASAPVYQSPPRKVGARRLRHLVSLDLIENLFFGAATIFCLVIAALFLQAGVDDWRHGAYLVVFWAVLAYLALPRVHRVLTALYVPDYFFGRARTSDGLLGDPVNLAMRGDGNRVHATMRRAGWVMADPVTLTSAIRIVVSSVARRSYGSAPVSPLLLFGARQAFAYQREVAGNPSQRHHVRFWPCPAGWLLPGGHRVDWLAAGTYDRSVGLSLFTLQVTHKIDHDIDIERDYIVATIRFGVAGVATRVIKDFSTGYHSRNGGGDTVRTDGDLPVVDVTGVEPVDAPSAEKALSGPHSANVGVLHDVGRRPPSIILASVLIAASLIASLIRLLGAVAGTAGTAVDWESGGGAVAVAAVGAALVMVDLVMAALAWAIYRGSQGARLCVLALLSVSQIGELIQAWTRRPLTFSGFVAVSVDLLIIYALTSLSAREWTRSHA